MKKILKYILFFLAVSVFNCQNTENSTELISPEELQVLSGKESIQFIDVRTPNEYKEGHIQNAINVNFYSENFSEKITEFNPNQPVLIYCRSGKRSNKSVSEFKKAGFKKIYDLEGGILNWIEKGFKTVKE